MLDSIERLYIQTLRDDFKKPKQKGGAYSSLTKPVFMEVLTNHKRPSQSFAFLAVGSSLTYFRDENQFVFNKTLKSVCSKLNKYVSGFTEDDGTPRYNFKFQFDAEDFPNLLVISDSPTIGFELTGVLSGFLLSSK